MSFESGSPSINNRYAAQQVSQKRTRKADIQNEQAERMHRISRQNEQAEQTRRCAGIDVADIDRPNHIANTPWEISMHGRDRRSKSAKKPRPYLV